MTNQNPKKRTRNDKLTDLKSKPDHFLDCREGRHLMVRIGYFHWNDLGKRGICRLSRCQRCRTERETYFKADGKRFGTARYTYPDGYLLTGEGSIKPQDVVKESMKRSGIAANRESMTIPARRGLRSVG